MGTRARAASRQTAGGIPRSMRTMPRSCRRRAIPHGITTRSLRRSMMIDASRTRRALRTRLLSKAMPMRTRSQRWARLRLTRTMTTTRETRRVRPLLPPTAARMGIGGRPTLPSSTSGRTACCTASRTRRGAILAPSLRRCRARRLRRRNAKPAHASRATTTTIWRICFRRTRRCRTTTFTTSRRYVVVVLLREAMGPTRRCPRRVRAPVYATAVTITDGAHPMMSTGRRTMRRRQ